ncbi:MAG: 30S ribosomal protein S20 [Fibrobacteria bacterium]|nr:30S ribosomal protein S20 [Fibrobacteria bacterium]
MPNCKSAKKRLRTAAKANARNRVTRTIIRNSIKKIRTHDAKEEVEQEVSKLFSVMDKAAHKSVAGFSKNRVANYKRKMHKRLASLAA